MKKLISCYFLVFMLTMVTIGKVDVKAEEKGLNWNGFIYQIHTDTVTNNQHILIEDYVGTDKNITFPEKIEGLPVTELAEQFTCTSNIVSAKITDTMLKPEGLAYCETLEKILVDDNSVRYTVTNGILYDRKVTKLLCYPSAKKDRQYIVPKTVTEAYGLQQLLSKNQFLKDVTFTSVVPECANTNIKNVKISGDITYIPDGAFRNCKKLKTVEIGKKVEVIDQDAFNNCTSLTSVKLPNTLSSILDRAFENTALKSIKLPNGLRRIYSYAFWNTKIKKVTIPKSVDYIGYEALPHKVKVSKPSYLKKVVNPWNKSQYGYRAYVTTKTKSGTKKYRASKVTKVTTVNKKVKLKKGLIHVIKTRIYVFKKKKPGYIKNDILEFTSSDSKVAKVTSGGKIIALKKGTATITVTMRTYYGSKLHSSRKKYKIKVQVS